MTITNGRFEWDSEKNKENMRKHGLCFEEIVYCFDDPFFFETYDRAHSTYDEV